MLLKSASSPKEKVTLRRKRNFISTSLRSKGRIILLAVIASLAVSTSAQALEPAPTLSAEGNVLHWTEVKGCSEYRIGYLPAGEGVWPGFESGTGGSGLTSQFEASHFTQGAKIETRVQCWKPATHESEWSNIVTIVPNPLKASNTLGKARPAPDTHDWEPELTKFLKSEWKSWVVEHVSYLRLYHGSQGEATTWGVPNESYRDWPASWEGIYAPLNETRRNAFINEKAKEDKTLGFEGEFLDDINFSTSARDNLQNRTELEPERAEEGRFLTALREAWGARPKILDCNTHPWDALANKTSAAWEEELKACNVLTKEFGFYQGESGETGTKKQYEEGLEWADLAHAAGDQVRVTGHVPVTETSFEYNEASYYIITEDANSFHGDLLWLSKQRPETTCTTTVGEGKWWCGLNEDLGQGEGGRVKEANGVYVRHFSGGEAVANPPENGTKTVKLPREMSTIKGSKVKEVTLGPAEGAVLTG